MKKFSPARELKDARARAAIDAAADGWLETRGEKATAAEDTALASQWQHTEAMTQRMKSEVIMP